MELYIQMLILHNLTRETEHEKERIHSIISGLEALFWVLYQLKTIKLAL
jgi:hypothetical protein